MNDPERSFNGNLARVDKGDVTDDCHKRGEWGRSSHLVELLFCGVYVG